MTGVMLETPVLVALVTAAGGVIGGIVAKALMGRKDSAALAMEIAQQARDDVKELRQEIAELRAELAAERHHHDGTRKKRRILEEKYSAALEWIVVVRTREASGDRRALPPLPMIVLVDVEPVPPCDP